MFIFSYITCLNSIYIVVGKEYLISRQIFRWAKWAISRLYCQKFSCKSVNLLAVIQKDKSDVYSCEHSV